MSPQDEDYIAHDIAMDGLFVAAGSLGYLRQGVRALIDVPPFPTAGVCDCDARGHRVMNMHEPCWRITVYTRGSTPAGHYEKHTADSGWHWTATPWLDFEKLAKGQLDFATL